MNACSITRNPGPESTTRRTSLIVAAFCALLMLPIGIQSALADDPPKREDRKGVAPALPGSKETTGPAAAPGGAPAAEEPDAAPADTPAAPEEEIDEEPDEVQPPSSEEQGRTSLDESFRAQTRRQWIRETRRKALKDTKFDVQLRTFYFNRDKFDDSESETLATGGSAGFKTGYFRERVALGVTGYTSLKLYGPDSKDGALMLKPGQRSYAVLGQAYGDILITDGVHAVLGLQAIDTPYINRNDVRMTPNTFEAYVVQGVIGGKDGKPEWRFGAGYVDEIKERNADEFVSMARDAGADVSRGVWVAGGNVKVGGFSLGAIDYYSDDVINIAYTETKYALTIGEQWRLQFAAQYSDQRSTGRDLLTGSSFSAGQFGLKGEVGYGNALLTTAFTTTENGKTNMQSPWSGYPGYTSVQVEDFNRGGENAFMLRGAYKFTRISGLSVYGLWVTGSEPSDPEQYSKDELNLNVQYAVGSGWFEGLGVRLRYAHVIEDGGGDSNLDDFRLIFTYDPPLL